MSCVARSRVVVWGPCLRLFDDCVGLACQRLSCVTVACALIVLRGSSRVGGCVRCEYVCVLRTHHCCRGAVALLNSAARGHVTAMACYAPAGCTISGVALRAGHLMRCDVMCFGAKSRVPRGVLRLFLRVAAWRGRRRGRRSAARPVSENITVACELRSRRPAPWSRLRARRQLLPAREVHELAGVKRHRWWP